ncbi:MAG: alpha-amylase [Anaerolineae bacterium]|nr:alpha-amylase [Anaerolineae bacterium]
MSLTDVLERIEYCRRPLSQPYSIPGLWIDSKTTSAAQVDPYSFYQRKISDILHVEPQPLIEGSGGGEWTRYAVIYNLFPRVTAAWDHDNDGYLSQQASVDGWRDTGTLLKCIALLPYIRNMGFNTIHLLPVMSVGQDGKKGTLGSPYSTRNLYHIDPNLDEPALGLTAPQLLNAFVEGAHRLGMRVTTEFVLRIAARDADWVKEHPDWFYWIRADIPDRVAGSSVSKTLNSFGPPHLSPEAVGQIKHKIGAGDYDDLPAPSEHYQAMFTPPPAPHQVYMEDGRYFGTLDDGTKVRVPGAFSDWHFEDSQPLWSDATYFRLYTHPDFNYMAYNTLRIYDNRLTEPEYVNEPLWQSLVGVIPHYQHEYNIDGVLIDMGHALPITLKQRMVATARAINPDFAFWDENFSISDVSRREGYNAVMGWWMLGAHHGDDLRNLLRQLAHQPFPVHFFAAPENHNTPRAASRLGGTIYSHYALAMAMGTPGLPFILSGFELGETQPMNTGMGFNREELDKYPADKLPLFSQWSFNWTRPDNLVKSVTVALGIRKRYDWLFTDPDPATFMIGYSDNPAIVVFSRRKDDAWITFIGNADPTREQRGRAVLNVRTGRVPGLWGTGAEKMELRREVISNVTLSPAYVLIIDGGEVVRL